MAAGKWAGEQDQRVDGAGTRRRSSGERSGDQAGERAGRLSAVALTTGKAMLRRFLYLSEFEGND